MVKTIKKTYKNKIKRKTNTKIKSQKKSMKKLKGGRKLGKGGFGCVVKPYIKCDMILDPRMHVSKLVFKGVNSKTLVDEIKISNMIKKIDKDNKYFITYTEMCNLDRKHISRPDIVDIKYGQNNDNLFEILNESGLKKKDKDACYIDFTQKPKNIIMIDGGIDLNKIIKYNSSIIIKYKINIKKNLARYLLKLLMGIKKLHNANIVHKDIKPLNILVNYKQYDSKFENKGKKLNEDTNLDFRFIDFGLSVALQHIKHLHHITSSGTTGYVPPELVILHQFYKLTRRNFDPQNKADIENLKDSIIKLLKPVMDKLLKRGITRSNLKMQPVDKNTYFYKNCIFSENDIKKLVNLLYKNIKRKTLFSRFTNNISGFLYKSDIFALGITFFMIYDSINEKNNDLLDLIRNMIKCNPDERYDINQCLKHPYFKQLTI